MNTMFLCQSEQIDQEINLHQRLPSGHGDTAALIERAVTLEIVYDLLRISQSTVSHGPCVRIMAIRTSHGTSLYKYDISHAGAVYGSEAFEGMYLSFGHILSPDSDYGKNGIPSGIPSALKSLAVRSEALVECTADNICLLLGSQLNEVNCIS